MIATQTKITDCQNSQEVMEKAELNFIPEGHELISVHGIDIPNHKALIRNDNKFVLSVVGKDYTAFPPAQSFAILDHLAQDHKARYTRAFAIDGGRRIIIEMEPEGHIKVGDDILRKRIHLHDSYDGSSRFFARYCLEKAACKNLQIWDAQETSTVAIRHTKNAQERLKMALHVWNISLGAFAAIQESFERLNQTIVDRERVKLFYDKLLGEITEESSTKAKNKREKIEYLFEHGAGNHGRTAWDLYNSVTEYADHYAGSNPEKRLASAIVGTGSKLKEKAFRLASTIR